jgi:iron-sulfur cluster repair protein YtfE (RIC family)
MTNRDAAKRSDREDRPEVAHDLIDFTGMYATHDAFRRDLDRLVAAAEAGKGNARQVDAGWDNFKTQLLIHHGIEDINLWPAVRRAVADQPDDLALAEEMVAEHDQLDPLVTAVDEALIGAAVDLSARSRELSAALKHHLTHEEEKALPLIQSVLTPADWRRFTRQMARRQGVRGAAVYVPWILDGSPTAAQHRFVAALPAPLRMINRLLWQPRYRKRSLWNF